MSWPFYLAVWAFLSLVFAVFYAVAFAVLMGIRENYLRYYQKADLQWTGSSGEVQRPRLKKKWLLAAALTTAWLAVEFIISP